MKRHSPAGISGFGSRFGSSSEQNNGSPSTRGWQAHTNAALESISALT
jgi:hypothetical protein